MVTRNRVKLARRAVQCFAQQTWTNKELVIIDDGTEDYEPILAPYRGDHEIRYLQIDDDESVKLGGLRNMAIEESRGDVLIQWDDDEWYHPDRIRLQVEALDGGVDGGLDASVLAATLVHLDVPEFLEHPFHTRAEGRMTPGTIAHRRTDVRYPNLSKGEDAVYIERLREAGKVGVVPHPHTHLFIRCFHGTNTWDLNHFHGALKKTPGDSMHYWFARYVRRNLRHHPAFALTDLEQETTKKFLADSRALGLLEA